MLSVVIPVYNRLENMKLCLAGLLAQKEAPEFEIIIVDDGSDDGLREWVESFVIEDPLPQVVRLRYMSGGPNKGFRGGRARNIGAFNADGSLFVFVDSDVVLNEHSLFYYGKAHEAYPEVVIVGAYHWLPPLRWSAENQHLLWTASSYEDLIQLAVQSGVQQREDVINDTPFDLDVRNADYTDDINALREGAGLGGLSGNIAYPKGLFWRVGGFDERIVGHGGEDADLGLTVDAEKTKWVFYKPIFGFHLWHPRNQMENAREVQANIAFIDAKHGVGQYANAKKWMDAQDWSDPIHYHHHLSPEIRLIKVGFEPQVYIWREGHYLKLNSPKWLIHLGFTWNDLEIVDQKFIDDSKYEGDAIWPEVEPASPIPEPVRESPGVNLSEIVDTGPTSIEVKRDVKWFKKSEGGILMREENSPTVFVARENFRMGISHPDWIIWLGFAPDEVKLVRQIVLDMLTDVGPTPDPKVIYTGEINRVY